MHSNNNDNKSASAPLPYGWVQQDDPSSGQMFWVDTKSTPPRSIWTHPYQDEQYLSQHPDVREKVGGASSMPMTSSDRPPSYPDTSSGSDEDRSRGNRKGCHGKEKKTKRGLLGALKEARVEHKQRKEEQNRMMQQMNQERMANMQSQGMYGPMQGGRNQYAAPMSMYPGGGGGMMGMSGGGMGMGGMGGGGMMGGQRRGGGMGGMGMGLPLVGGLAGGMLLGDMMDNNNGYGGGGYDGGGGYGDGGGGDFGGGDFGGGDF